MQKVLGPGMEPLRLGFRKQDFIWFWRLPRRRLQMEHNGFVGLESPNLTEGMNTAVHLSHEYEQLGLESPEVVEELNHHADSDFRTCMLSRLLIGGEGFGLPALAEQEFW